MYAIFVSLFVDVIGVVEGYDPLSKITTKFGLRDIVHFRLTDGRYEFSLQK